MLSNSEILERAMISLGFTKDSKLSLAQEQDLRAAVWAIKRAQEANSKRDRKAPKPIGDMLQGVFASVGNATESPMEDIFLFSLNTRSMLIGEFQTQYPVGPYILDFAFPKVKLCLETDGAHHRLDPGQVTHDQRRTAYLSKLGWTVVRFNWDEVRNNNHETVERVVKIYESMLARKGLKEPWE